MNSKERGLETFSKGYSCAQAVFSALSESIGIDRQSALKTAGAFGGGMGRNGLTCGAVTGALMAIGYKYGKDSDGDTTSKENTYKKVNLFFEDFKNMHGALDCSSLVKHDVTNDVEYKKAVESGVFKNLCPKLVESAIEIAEKILKD